MLFLTICFVGLLQFATVTAIPTFIKTAVSSSSINKEYKLQYYVKANWYNAYLFCRDNGMRLATINSQEEQDYLVGLIEDLGLISSWWIAGTDLATEGRFSWLSSGKLFKYTNWLAGHPDNHNQNEHCLEFRFDYKWNDFPCDHLFSIICENDT